MEERSLKIMEADKAFFSKISNTLSKLLIPTRIGINSMLISVKRNNMLKHFEMYEEEQSENIDKQESLLKKYEESFALYLESIDKNVMDSIYKKVKNKTAKPFEENALSQYYTITRLKEKQYVEYKYRKQEYLIDLDYQTVKLQGKEKVINRYNKFYVSKMDSIYKGLLKNYSIQLADNLNNKYESKEYIYDQIFKVLADYIENVLPVKMKNSSDDTYKNITEAYEDLKRFSNGKIDESDYIEKNKILLGISRQLFTHSLPLIVAEQCYRKLLKDARELLVKTENNKQQKVYKMLMNLIEDFNVKLLSTKIYWDNYDKRENYKKFWERYNEICSRKAIDAEKYIKDKEVLFIREELNNLKENEKKNAKIIQFYKNKLVEYGVIRNIKNSCKTAKKYKKKVLEENGVC